MYNEDEVEPDIREISVSLPDDWDPNDTAALLRRAADELDEAGSQGMTVLAVKLCVEEQSKDLLPKATLVLQYRRHRFPPVTGRMDIPIRDTDGRVIGAHSRPSGIVGHGPRPAVD